MTGEAMETQWDRVARWARMGNNRGVGEQPGEHAEEQVRSEDEMGNEMTEQGSAVEDLLEPEMVSGTAEAGETAEMGRDAAQVELEQVKGERDQMKDRLARLQAEFDNARKREAKERQDAREYTVSSTVEPFLGVMDNFNLALKAEGSAEQLKTGVEMILKQMDDALRALNVQPVEAVGAQFDPRVHEALGSIETKEFPDHQVLEEIRRGYKLRERLLRPAMVRIASNPDQVSE